MRSMKIQRCGLSVFAVLVFLMAGCGEPAKTTVVLDTRAKLGEIAQMLKTIAGTETRPPMRPADLDAVEPLLPASAQDIRSGEIVYVWGAVPGGPGIVAYERKVPTEGGLVLKASGDVVTMSVAEFKAMK